MSQENVELVRQLRCRATASLRACAHREQILLLEARIVGRPAVPLVAEATSWWWGANIAPIDDMTTSKD